MATLTSKITETITINGVQQGGTTTHAIANIVDNFKRVILVPSSEILLYDTHTSNVAGSTFDRDNVKYVKITNLNSTYYVDLLIKNSFVMMLSKKVEHKLFR